MDNEIHLVQAISDLFSYVYKKISRQRDFPVVHYYNIIMTRSISEENITAIHNETLVIIDWIIQNLKIYIQQCEEDSQENTMIIFQIVLLFQRIIRITRPYLYNPNFLNFMPGPETCILSIFVDFCVQGHCMYHPREKEFYQKIRNEIFEMISGIDFRKREILAIGLLSYFARHTGSFKACISYTHMSILRLYFLG